MEPLNEVSEAMPKLESPAEIHMRNLRSHAEEHKNNLEQPKPNQLDESSAKRLLKEQEREAKRLLKDQEKEKQRVLKEQEKMRKRDEIIGRRCAEIVERGVEEDIIPFFEMEDGRIAKTTNNVIIFLEKHHRYMGKIEKNLFNGNYEIDRKQFDDEMLIEMTVYVERLLGFRHKDMVYDAVVHIACNHPYHPVLEKLESLVWDGKKRVETFFIDRVGAEDTALTREISAKWLYAMLKRQYEPGCYFDHFLILTDPTQGTGKTKTFERLTTGLQIPNLNVLTNTHLSPSLEAKDNAMKLTSSIIGVFDDITSTSWKNLGEFKNFVSTTDFSMRFPYDRTTKSFKVHCVYTSTTNEETFLTDSTGNDGYERRAWVVPCHGKKRTVEEWETLNNDHVIQQVWAELRSWHLNPETAPYKIDGNNVTELSSTSVSALIDLQRGRKTSSEDYKLLSALETIFRQKYSSDKFATPQDFVRDHDRFYHATSPVYDCDLKVIPAKYLYVYVDTMIGKGGRTGKYIKSVILGGILNNVIGEWVYVERKFYNGSQVACYVKKSELKSDEYPKMKSKTNLMGGDMWNEQKNLPL